MSKYRGFSGPYFPVFGLNSEIYGVIFSPNTGKYGPEKPPFWTFISLFHAVYMKVMKIICASTMKQKGLIVHLDKGTAQIS